MLENYLMSQLRQDMDRGYICQQDGAAPHFHCETTSYLNRTAVAWIGRGGTIAWPLRSPDLAPLDFSVWEYDEEKGFVPPFPASWEKLSARITGAVATIDEDKIDGIWKEIAYKWDICCVTRGNHCNECKFWISELELA